MYPISGPRSFCCSKDVPYSDQINTELIGLAILLNCKNTRRHQKTPPFLVLPTLIHRTETIRQLGVDLTHLTFTRINSKIKS
jgi:hypothetical protein